MNKLNRSMLVFLTVIANSVFAQPYQKTNAIPVYVNNVKLNLPWAGGTNHTMFNTMDLNGDGLKDLILFERQYAEIDFVPGIFRITTYLNAGINGQVKYLWAPQYISCFPNTIKDWMTLVDYDCDGLEDIFCQSLQSGVAGIAVFHCNGMTPSGPTFSLKKTFLESKILGSSFITNLYNASINKPAMWDVNNDGDLDVCVVPVQAGTIEYHENQSMELYGICDSLIYEAQTYCWGGVCLTNGNNTANLHCCVPFTANEPERITLHSGSCMTPFDDSLDSDCDIIHGDILANSLLYLNNSIAALGSFDSQDSLYPVYNNSVNYIRFPAAYYLDVDNDAAKDMIVSSCDISNGSILGGSQNFNNNLFYKNTSNNITNQFNFIKNRFLTDEMIDVGSGANPAFEDVDGDGLLDLLIGNFGYYNSSMAGNAFLSGITFYKNIGTHSCPEFELITPDYMGIQSLGLLAVYPSFGDLDADGDNDLLIGEEDGKLYYFINNPVSGIANYTLAPNGIQYQGIDVGDYSTPQIVDFDGDGKKDLLIGHSFGTVYYYQNTGTLTNPIFTLVTSNFGAVDVTDTINYCIFGNSQPYLYMDNGIRKLAVGCDNGTVFLYDNITPNPAAPFHLITNKAFNIEEPFRCSIAMADLNGDSQSEIAAGVYAGGVAMYSMYIDPSCPATAVGQIANQTSAFSVYPIPSVNHITIETTGMSNNKLISVYDLTGRKILFLKSAESKTVIDINWLTPGVYIVKVDNGQNLLTQKFVVK